MKIRNVLMGIAILLAFLIISCSMDTGGGGGGGSKGGKHGGSNGGGNPPQTIVNPTVKSFASKDGVIIQWDANPNANGYILYRDTDPNGDFSTKVYEGPWSASYPDTNVSQETFYYYKLKYKNGSTISDYSCGRYSASVKNDEFEDNDQSSDAYNLTPNNFIPGTTYNANIFYYDDGVGNILVDTDWYSVDVPAGNAIEVTFTLNALPGFNVIADEDLYYIIEGDPNEYLIANNGAFVISGGKQGKQVKFKVSVKMDKFLDKFGSYSITVE